jgi:hypothetical protein
MMLVTAWTYVEVHPDLPNFRPMHMRSDRIELSCGFRLVTHQLQVDRSVVLEAASAIRGRI